MISQESFREQWGDDDSPLVVFPATSTADVAMTDAARDFLNNAGLPESAAPFLGFAAPKHGPLPRASDQWGIGAGFSHYRVIGSNDSGDPICIDESADGKVVYLNHDNRFECVFINSSVPQLAAALLAFRQLVRDTQERNGQDAYLDGNVPADLVQRLRAELQRIDPPALNADAFWRSQFGNFQGETG